MKNICKIPGKFSLECGGNLSDIEIAYHTYGTLRYEKDNVIWVCHALTANSDVADWWPHTVETDKFLDPRKWFIICANILGSPYGSTSPLSINPDTGEQFFNKFPRLTMRDIVNAHKLLADHLGLRHIHALIGSSVGGFQALEWAVSEPKRFRKLILIGTAEAATPWTIAINETQRMAIATDPTFGLPRQDAGARGLEAARAIGLLTYRGADGYNRTQADPGESDILSPLRRASTYQRYQGEKLRKRFNAYSYKSILDAFDTHDIGRGRGGHDTALGTITAETLIVGQSSDMIFPPEDMIKMSRKIAGAEYKELSSPFGHDGFLVEHQQLNNILSPFINK